MKSRRTGGSPPRTRPAAPRRAVARPGRRAARRRPGRASALADGWTRPQPGAGRTGWPAGPGPGGLGGAGSGAVSRASAATVTASCRSGVIRLPGRRPVRRAGPRSASPPSRRQLRARSRAGGGPGQPDDRARHRGDDLLRRPGAQRLPAVQHQHRGRALAPRPGRWSPAPRPLPAAAAPAISRHRPGPADRVDAGGRLVQDRAGPARAAGRQITPSFCRMPPDSCPASRSRAAVSPARSISSADRSPCPRRRQAVGGGAEGQVLGHGEVRVGARSSPGR